MNALIFLIVFPLVISFLALVVPHGLVIKKIIGVCANIALCAVPIYLLITNLDRGPAYFNLENKLIDIGMFLVELIIAFYIVYVSVRSKRYLPVFMVAVQSLIMLTLEFNIGQGMHVEHSLFVDKFSIIMALIVGIIGSAICLYAIGYIPEYYEHHKKLKDRRDYFAFLMYLFLSAMFGIIFSNNLKWLYFFWEITTACSFLLIGFKDDKPSQENAFRALNMNLLGGVVFAIGLVYLYYSSGVMELDKLLRLDKGVVLLPAVCLAFAGLVKSAQFPFCSWLTGAMVAPTPVSALLHSSTMVKAGVYLILRVAPVMENTLAAKMLTLIGGVSFLITALIAISQSNAKKVLAYSTISNLGLIVACAGLNTDAAVWSALLLIIFHAVAKSLLFLCVGVIENKLGSRDIEDMDFLIMRLPKLSAIM
ncbi:MAG TPA: proton-conducting transporter membrane subunit, partial [Geobacteraceae bacterium]|nr:proton-conducting transporter membrane subunit [Geobacteraceae bacterium]